MRFTPFHPGHSKDVTREEENSLPATRHRDRVSPGKGLSPGPTISAPLCKRESRAGTFFSHCFFRRSKAALLSVGNPDTGKGVVRGVCQSAFSYRAWEAVRRFHVRCSYWDRSTSVSAGDRRERSKPAVLDPYPKAEKLFIFEPS